MSNLSDVYVASTAVYVLALSVLLAWLRRVPESRRRYCYPILGVLAVSTVASALVATGFGQVPVNGTELDVPGMVDDLVTYSVLWPIVVLLANGSRRMLGIAVVLPFVQVLSFNAASVVGGPLALLGLGIVVAGHGVIAYLVVGPVWESARDVPDKQRLLYWKSRNLLLFLIGMLIAFAVLSVAGIFDEFVVAVLHQYVDVLIRVGFAGFLFANLDDVETVGIGRASDHPGAVGAA